MTHCTHYSDEMGRALCGLTDTPFCDRAAVVEALYRLQLMQGSNYQPLCYSALWRALQALTAAHYYDKEEG